MRFKNVPKLQAKKFAKLRREKARQQVKRIVSTLIKKRRPDATP